MPCCTKAQQVLTYSLACRLRFNEAGLITDQWTWRGATTDEAEWLLTRSYKPFAFDYVAG
jgi:hypothetical protein